MNRMKSAVKLLAGFVALGAVLFSVGCSSVYVPKESEFATDQIPQYIVGSQVEFKNGQTSKENVLFATNMGHEFYADLHEWTNKAIAIADRELTKRGSKMTEKPGHVLTLSVMAVQVTSGGWGFRGKVTLDAATGNGITKSFQGEAPGANLHNVASGALSSTVTKMLSDPEIVKYLSQ
jgi:hypothetical protein